MAALIEVAKRRKVLPDPRGSEILALEDHAFRLYPPRNGSVFRIIEYLPNKQRGTADRSGDFRAMDGGRA
jgi:hypothetical protein